jgi:peptide-methionine (S)-S-oxide reductase
VDNPRYQAVCSGTTGHAEVMQITFDPDVISYDNILYIFWRMHDPTTPNRQGADVGTQYRSIIFYHDETQQEIAEHSRKQADASDLWDSAIVTEVVPLTRFYPAEDYHQNYYRNNPRQPYCTMVIDPKVDKFKKSFQDMMT